MKRKVYLDDCRKPPFGWELVKTADVCIAALERLDVTELSLDHDLAEEHYDDSMLRPEGGGFDSYNELRTGFKEKTGLDVVKWMIEHLPPAKWPEKITIHTMNPAGRMHMQSLLENWAPPCVQILIRTGWSG